MFNFRLPKSKFEAMSCPHRKRIGMIYTIQIARCCRLCSLPSAFFTAVGFVHCCRLCSLLCLCGGSISPEACRAKRVFDHMVLAGPLGEVEHVFERRVPSTTVGSGHYKHMSYSGTHATPLLALDDMMYVCKIHVRRQGRQRKTK